MVYVWQIKDTKWAVCICGFKGARVKNIDLLIESIKRRLQSNNFQLFNADMIAGWGHLFFASVNAVNAFIGGKTISRSLPVEVALYASCQQQISKALTEMGVKPGTERIAIVMLASTVSEAKKGCKKVEDLIGSRDDSVLEISTEKFTRLKKHFNISDQALEAVGGPSFENLTNLIIEKGSLLPTHR